MELTEEEILQILKILDESNFDQMHLEIGDLKLSVSKSGAFEPIEGQPQKQPSAASQPQPLSPAPEKQENRDSTEKPAMPEDPVDQEGTEAIKAPLMGIFYSRPDPDSPPYVEVGKFVNADDTVGLIEVMKLFNSVKAGVQGQIVRVCVESGQMVEYGQPLFLIKP